MGPIEDITNSYNNPDYTSQASEREASLEVQNFMDHVHEIADRDEQRRYDDLYGYLLALRPTIDWKAIIDECKKNGPPGYKIFIKKAELNLEGNAESIHE